jgi:integrase
MILIAYRHGLRASELCALQWDQVDLAHGRLHVSRAKNGVPSVHPLGGVELRALRRLQRDQEDSRYVFLSERGAPMGPPGFRRMVARLGCSRQDSVPSPPAHAPARPRLQVRASIPAGRLSAERWRCALEPRQAAPLHGGALPR